MGPVNEWVVDRRDPTLRRRRAREAQPKNIKKPERKKKMQRRTNKSVK